MGWGFTRPMMAWGMSWKIGTLKPGSQKRTWSEMQPWRFVAAASDADQ